MKTIKISAICAPLIILLTAVILTSCSAQSQTKPANFNNGPGFAVLELFTSEGCSSCPPADELMARLQQEAGDKPIYILAYHVDYWNRLGWKDVFSKADFSKRQYWYKSLFTTEVYTPQLIINGHQEFVGSSERDIRKSLAEALGMKGPCTFYLNVQQQAGGLKLDYQLSAGSRNNQLVIALVQKHAISKIKAGENEGRTLSHVQIVNNLQTFDLNNAQKGSQKIDLPKGFNTNDWEVIGLIQNAETGVINAAARATFNQSASL